MGAPQFVSIHGKRFGLGPNGPVFEGRVVGTTPIAQGRGKTFYVDSNIAGNDGRSPATAVASIVTALTYCTANQGDMIVVMPKHAETISAAGGITVSTAGVSIIGLGYGNQRPTITFGTANTATFLVSAAGVYIENMIFSANFLAVAVGIGISATDCWLNNLEFRNAGSSKNFTSPIKVTSTTSNAADGLRVQNCRWGTNGDTAGGPMISIAGTNGYVVIVNNYMNSAATATAQLVSVATGKILTDAEIGWNKCFNLMTSGELFISNDGTTNTGIIHNNYVGHADVTGTHDAGWDGGGFRLFNNLSTSVDNLSGLVLPAIDVNL